MDYEAPFPPFSARHASRLAEPLPDEALLEQQLTRDLSALASVALGKTVAPRLELKMEGEENPRIIFHFRESPAPVDEKELFALSLVMRLAGSGREGLGLPGVSDSAERNECEMVFSSRSALATYAYFLEKYTNFATGRPVPNRGGGIGPSF